MFIFFIYLICLLWSRARALLIFSVRVDCLKLVCMLLETGDGRYRHAFVSKVGRVGGFTILSLLLPRCAPLSFFVGETLLRVSVGLYKVRSLKIVCANMCGYDP